MIEYDIEGKTGVTIPVTVTNKEKKWPAWLTLLRMLVAWTFYYLAYKNAWDHGSFTISLLCLVVATVKLTFNERRVW